MMPLLDPQALQGQTVIVNLQSLYGVQNRLRRPVAQFTASPIASARLGLFKLSQELRNCFSPLRHGSSNGLFLYTSRNTRPWVWSRLGSRCEYCMWPISAALQSPK